MWKPIAGQAEIKWNEVPGKIFFFLFFLEPKLILVFLQLENLTTGFSLLIFQFGVFKVLFIASSVG